MLLMTCPFTMANKLRIPLNSYQPFISSVLQQTPSTVSRCINPSFALRSAAFPSKQFSTIQWQQISHSKISSTCLLLNSRRDLQCEKSSLPPPSRPSIIEGLRAFHAASSFQRDHHFDTLKLVHRLQDEGFTEGQSVAVMNILSDVIEESVQNLKRTMVLKEEQEKITYTQKVDFSQLRSDLETHHSLEYASTRNEYERLTSEIAKLNSRLREEIIRAQNSVKLDLNLEKGRIREEASVHELKIKETDTRIETEVGAIRATLEAVKFSTLQWLIGVCTGTAALILGVWRLLA